MDRRTFLLGTAGLLAASHPAQGQPSKVAKVGADPNLADLRRSLRDLGYFEECNLSLAYRFAEGRTERLPELARELVRLKPDLKTAQALSLTIPPSLLQRADQVIE